MLIIFAAGSLQSVAIAADETTSVPAEQTAVTPAATPSVEKPAPEVSAPNAAPTAAAPVVTAPPAPVSPPIPATPPTAAAATAPTEAPAAAPALSVNPNETPTGSPPIPPRPVTEAPPKRPLVQSARNQEYSKGLFFDQRDKGVLLPPMHLEYNLFDNGNKLSIGNVALSEENFFFALLPMGKTHSQIGKVLSSEEAAQYAFVMRWPEPLLADGNLEMISKTGALLWKMEITKEMRERWAKKLQTYRKELREKGVKDIKTSGLFATQYVEQDFEKLRSAFVNQRDIFRFCISQREVRAQTKLCSRWYGIKPGKNGGMIMGKARVDVVTPRVLVQNEAAPMKDDKVVSEETPTTFFAEMANGESYEFVAVPNKPNLMDVADTVKPKVLRIIGYDTRPTTPSVILNPDQYNALTKMIGFEATIGDNRKFWVTTMREDDPILYLPGQGGGVFKQKFELSQIPRDVSRPYLERRTPNETYYDDFKLYGRKRPDVRLTTDENSVVEDPDRTHFVWYFKAENRGEINRSYLNVTYKGKTYRSYYEVFKGFPRELSARFTGVVAAGQSTILGEVAYNQWFEDIFGWTNYYLARHRWGASVKTFQTFGGLKVGADGTTAKLGVTTVDLKYRFTPGLWGRDESIGAMFSYQSVTFGSINAPMMGAGAFWARSMPRLFNDFFNYFPFMDYPKWVDMEFIYYASGMNKDVTLNTNFALNFHGKVLWSKRVFGEAGFGLKRFAFTDNVLAQRAALNSLYATVGLGITF